MAKTIRISKTTRWVLTIGVLAILLGGAGVSYSRQKAEQSELSSSIAQTQQELIKYEMAPVVQKEELEAKLAEANSIISSLQNEFRRYTESIEISEALFEAAENSSVTITRLVCSCPTYEEINGIPYCVFTLNITGEAEVPPALINFSMKISEIFAAANMESVAMHVQEDEKATMDLGLKIYVYE